MSAHRGPRPLIGRCALEAEPARRDPDLLQSPGVPAGGRDGHQDRDRPAGQCPVGMPACRPVQGVYALFDGDDGSPIGDHRRDRADLPQDRRRQRPGLTAAEPCGCARAAPGGCRRPRALSCERASGGSAIPGARCQVWNRSEYSRRDRWRAGSARTGSGPRPSPELEPAVRAADIVCCSTAATEPLLRGRGCDPGSHVDLVGGFTPDDARVRRRRRRAARACSSTRRALTSTPAAT